MFFFFVRQIVLLIRLSGVMYIGQLGLCIMCILLGSILRMLFLIRLWVCLLQIFMMVYGWVMVFLILLRYWWVILGFWYLLRNFIVDYFLGIKKWGYQWLLIVFFLVGQEVVNVQFFCYFFYLFQVFKGLLGFGFIYYVNCYVYVYQYIVVYFGMGYYFQVCFFNDVVKGYFGDLDEFVVFGFYCCYFFGDC